MKLFQFIIIRLLLFLVIGIIIGYFFPPNFTLSLYFLAAFFAISGSLLLFKKQHNSIVFGIFISITFTILGIVLTQLHNPLHWSTHYSKHIKTNQECPVTLKIKTILKPNRYSQRYIANIVAVNNKPLSGNILLYVKNDSLASPLNVDDILFTKSTFNSIKPPSNPNQFNYKSYLKKHYIFHDIKTTSSFIFLFNEEAHSIYGYASALREHIITKLKTHPFTADQLAIINALLLGKRHDIDASTFDKYSNAGAIHILAISGLHIGILLIILNLIFKPLDALTNNTTYKSVIIVFLLWGVAFVTGLSASVVRAVTLFNILQLATLLNRPTNIYNTLAVSAFIILLIKPLYLFDIGFQLSYAAVLAIITIQPLALKLWYPKNTIVRYFWAILSVSIAAQIGVLPLSLFYFHKFAGLFWLTNLLLIPIIGSILGIGITVIILALVNTLPIWLAKSFGILISAMNAVISWISGFESFVFEAISFNLTQTVIMYVFIFCCIQFFISKIYYWLVATFLAIILFQAEAIIDFSVFNTNQFVIFHKHKSTIIGVKKHKTLVVYSDLDSIKHNNLIHNYKTANTIQLTNYENISPVYKINNNYLLVVDSNGVYSTKSIIPKYILLKSSPKINLNRLIDSIKPKLIIADGSNYNTYIKRWQTTCAQKNTPFYQTAKKGAFIMNLNN